MPWSVQAGIAAAFLGLVLLLPGAAAEPPADAFCVITIQPLDDFRIVRVVVDQETNLTQREELFPVVDADGDGAIIPREKDQFRHATAQVHPDTTSLGVKDIRLDSLEAQSQPPIRALHAATWREVGHTFHQRNYTTPPIIMAPVDLETQEVREFRFAWEQPAGTLDRVMLVGGNQSMPPMPRPTPTAQPVIEYVVIRAPQGWRVQEVSGSSYDGPFFQRHDAQVVDVPAFDTKLPYTILFQRAPDIPTVHTVTVTKTVTKGSPDPSTGNPPATSPGPAPALVAALALAAASLRRRE